ncbi:GSCOCG00006890001-RA-CDS [Cotesia congregata]|nr:GSCOCG00006890001-RA-CDS [Cotesia congregata]
MKLLGAIILTLLAVECWGTRVQSSKKKKEVAADQTAASSFWSPAIKTGNIFSQDDNSNFFSAGHGLVQTHPISSTFQSGFGGIDDLGTRGATVRPPRTRPLDYSERATAELRRNPSLSAPDECARACREGEPPRICYYHFTLEYYSVLGAACQVCTPNATNTVWSHCQCVLADGVERGILTANRMIPGPSIQVCEGDKVVVDVENHMQGMEATIHWHGVWQRGSQYYDGVPYVTQCPIQEGNTFRYQWTAGNAGTHFWHAHTGLQKIDGLYGSVIVRQPPSKDPNSNLYDYDLTTHVVLISDWMHEDAAERYRFRLINSFGSVCPAQITFQGHELTLIATDGEPVQPVQVNTIISFSGERYDFVINADQPVGAYWIQLRGLGECGIKRAQQLGVLRYARGPYQPASQPPTYDLGLPQGVVLNPLDAICNMPRDDAVCVNQLKNAKPIDEGILQARPDVKIFLPFRFLFYRPEEVFQPNTYNRFLVAPTGDHVISLVDEISFTFPPAPPLSQIDDIPPEQFCNGDNRPADCGANCMCTHKVDIPHNAIVEVVLVDEVQQPNLSHPFHLHGYAFNVVGMGRSPDKNVKKINLKHALDLDRRGLLHREFNLPPSKDTIAVPNNGYVVFRFRADNPGLYFLVFAVWVVHF